VGLILISLTVFAVLYIVINTIQLTVYARRQEIEIMKLVGATDSFVRWPFLLEGVYLGIIGALISIFLLLEGYTILYGKAKSFTRILPVLSGFEVTTDLIVFLLAMGIFFGVLGSSLSVRRYLKV
jgi:cell division transport system permease protein